MPSSPPRRRLPHTFVIPLTLLAVATLPAGCAALQRQPRAFTLRLDPHAPQGAELCWKSARSPADLLEKDGEPGCTPWGNQDLTAPGTLSVVVENPREGETYDLRIEQFALEPSEADVQAVTKKVAANLAKLDAQTTKAAGPAAQPVIEEVKDKTDGPEEPDDAEPDDDENPDDDKKPGEPSPGDATHTTSAATARRPTSDAIFTPLYLVETAGRFTLRGPIDARPDVAKMKDVWLEDTNAPAGTLPPPRAYVLTTADLTYLEKEKKIPRKDIGDFVVAWCDPRSFQSDTRAAQYAALAQPPDVNALWRAVGTTPDEIVSALDGGRPLPPFGTRLQRLAAETSKDWGAASAEAKAAYLARLGAGLDVFARNCAANLTLLGRDPALVEPLGAAARMHAEAFIEVLAPLYAAARRPPPLHVGTFSLEPGRLVLGVGVTQTKEKKEVATYRSEVLGVERIALVAGPMVTMCARAWGCFDTIEELNRGGQRQFVRDRDQFDLAVATAVHLTLWSGAQQGIGALVGYPLGTPDSTSRNFLLGVGYRHHAGIEVSVGLHGFKSTDLRTGYETPFAVGEEDSALTLDAVTEPEWRGGVFVMVGFAPNVFPRPN